MAAFAAIAAPLHALTGKNRRFELTGQCEEAFQGLKEALVTSPILAMANDGYPFILDTDACDVSMGAVLLQVQNGKERVVACTSRSLSRQERSYCVTRKELWLSCFILKLLGSIC